MDAGLKQIATYFDASIAVQRRVADSCAEQILGASNAMATALKAGNKILLCGNGGSAADCQHFAAELVSGMSRNVKRPALAAIALTTDTSFLTAHANDRGFDGIFERQIEALGRSGDILVAISTSGRSENVRRAASAARALTIGTIGLIGFDAPLAQEVEYAIVIPDRNTQHIQEAFLAVEHLLCTLVEQALFGATKEAGDA
jgi:D-sedoheptulose 7-phosphate isomerase